MAGLTDPGHPLLTQRPFRSPHHTTSAAALAGGGPLMRPGEISLAHNGVLFLDELPEFHRDVLEALRQPLEDGIVTVARAGGTLRLPAQFQLVCAMNPCKCGWRGHPSGQCTCSDKEVEKYVQKISGPLLDRIDLHVNVPSVEYEAHAAESPSRNPPLRSRSGWTPPGPFSPDGLRAPDIPCNAQMTPAYGRAGSARWTPGATRLMKAAFERMGLTARSHDRVLRVARTIADLDGAAAYRRGAFVRGHSVPEYRHSEGIAASSIRKRSIGNFMLFEKSGGAVDWLIVGLGNPGQKYEHTRHNMGFLTVDLLAEKLNVKLNKVKFKSAYNIVRFGGQKCLVMKPQTYMNLSGEAVREAVQFYKIPADHVLVIYDDVSLPVGKLRVRPTGSAGGHNGIKNIIAHLGTQDFPRIKIGTGAPAGGGAEMIDWVIGVPSQAERKILVESFERAIQAAEDILENGCQKAMNDYN